MKKKSNQYWYHQPAAFTFGGPSTTVGTTTSISSTMLSGSWQPPPAWVIEEIFQRVVMEGMLGIDEEKRMTLEEKFGPYINICQDAFLRFQENGGRENWETFQKTKTALEGALKIGEVTDELKGEATIELLTKQR